MSDQRHPERSAPPEGAWFRDEVVPPTTPPAPAAGENPTVVTPNAGANRPFPPVTRQEPATPYGRMPAVGTAPRRAPAPQPRPDAYPPQPPVSAPAPGRGPLRRSVGGEEPPVGPPPTVTKSRRRRIGWKRPLAVALVLFLVLPLCLYFWADSKLDRIDAFPAASTRPAKTPGSDWLIVGSDSRDGLSRAQRAKLKTGQASGQRTDTMMLLHIPDSGGKPTLVSLPRDSYVPIPGHEPNRLNAAFAFGGPKLLVQTVENLTKIRIDHYAEIGFGGLFDLVNSVGGVHMCIDSAKKDPKAGLDIKKGCQNIDGAEALGIARSRASTRGDLDRVANQRDLIHALMDKVTSPWTLLNPFRLWSVAGKGVGAVAVDDGDHLLDLVHLAWAAKGVGTTTTVPIGAEFDQAGVGSVITWDKTRADALFSALRQDKQVPKSAQMS
jgi:LCP family protein required for cell wall assembly